MAWLGISLIVAGVFFSPGIRIHPDMPIVYLHDPVVLAALVQGIFFSGKKLKEIIFPLYLQPLNRPYLFTVIYISIVTGGAVMFGNDPFASLIGMLGRLKPFLTGIALWVLIRPLQDTKNLKQFFLAAIFVEFIIMYMQKENYFNVNEWLSPLYTDISSNKDLRYLRNGRIFGTFANPNNASTAMSILGLFAFSRATYDNGKIIRLVSLAAFILALFSCVSLTQSRQGTIALLSGCLFLQMIGFLSPDHRVRTLFMCFMLVALGVISSIMIGGIDELASERFSFFVSGASVLDTHSLSYRTDMLWPYRWQMLKGAGATMWLGQGKLYETVSWDSGLLDTFEEGGIPGALGMLAMIALPSVAAWKRTRTLPLGNTSYWIYAGCAAMAITLFLSSIVNTIWSNHTVMSVIVVIYVLVFSEIKMQNENIGQEIAPHTNSRGF